MLYFTFVLKSVRFSGDVQVRFVELGNKYISNNGSYVFTSGFLSHYPNPVSIATGPLNAAVDTFVKNTAPPPLPPRGIRINVVSPAPIVEPCQEGEGMVTAVETARLYVKAVEDNINGQVLRAWGRLPENYTDVEAEVNFKNG